jgi:hypothetical protein
MESFVERLIKRLVLEVVANMQAAPSDGGTPVDTGWARANWIPQIGTPGTSPAGTYAAALAGSLPNESQVGVATVATTYRLRSGPVFVSNNVPYIAQLNEGSSRQAPRGFVQAGIVRAVRTVAA